MKQILTSAALSSLLLCTGCSKNTINLDFGDTDEPSGSFIPKGSTLVTFQATVESRNLLTWGMSPMDKGIRNRLYAYKYPVANLTDIDPIAEGLYITSSQGVLIVATGTKCICKTAFTIFTPYPTISPPCYLLSPTAGRNPYTTESISYGGIVLNKM